MVTEGVENVGASPLQSACQTIVIDMLMSDWLESRSLYKKLVASAFGVPQELLTRATDDRTFTKELRRWQYRHGR